MPESMMWKCARTALYNVLRKTTGRIID